MKLKILIAALFVAFPPSTETQEIDPSTTIDCLVREYTYTISKPFTRNDGVLLECFDTVAVDSCWGRCDTSEIPDYKVPYKISNHPVCTYSARKTRMVTLRNCHPEHPDPTAEVFDAIACSCQACNPQNTNCENPNG